MFNVVDKMPYFINMYKRHCSKFVTSTLLIIVAEVFVKHNSDVVVLEHYIHCPRGMLSFCGWVCIP